MRYFLEVSYKGTKYAGSQVQKNANSVQAEIEKVLAVVLKFQVDLTGSSRTDAGVHALQNYFHFDVDNAIDPAIVYNLNALLPHDIVINNLFPVNNGAHSRFDATSREYSYFISTKKDPFTTETSWYYPYKIEIDLLNEAAEILYKQTDYTCFSKRNTQTFTNECTIIKNSWKQERNTIEYNVKANRFLRGMVRALVGTMLQVGRRKITIEQFESIIDGKDCTRSNFATPAHGLFLVEVTFPDDVIINRKL